MIYLRVGNKTYAVECNRQRTDEAVHRQGGRQLPVGPQVHHPPVPDNSGVDRVQSVVCKFKLAAVSRIDTST